MFFFALKKKENTSIGKEENKSSVLSVTLIIFHIPKLLTRKKLSFLSQALVHIDMVSFREDSVSLGLEILYFKRRAKIE